MDLASFKPVLYGSLESVMDLGRKMPKACLRLFILMPKYTCMGSCRQVHILNMRLALNVSII